MCGGPGRATLGFPYSQGEGGSRHSPAPSWRHWKARGGRPQLPPSLSLGLWCSAHLRAMGTWEPACRSLCPPQALGPDTDIKVSCLLLAGRSCACSRVGLFGLHFQDSAKQLLRRDCQEANLSIGVQAVQVGALGGQVLVDVFMVALKRGGGSAGCQGKAGQAGTMSSIY